MTDKRRSSFAGLIGPLFVALMMAAVALAALRDRLPEPASSKPVVMEPTQPAPPVSPHLLFGVTVPDGKTDKLYALNLGDHTVERQKVSPGWRIQELNPSNATIKTTEGKDSVGLLTTADGKQVPLRTPDGSPYQDPTVLGKLDDKHTAVLAKADDQTVLSVSHDGEIKKIFTVPENANPLPVQAGAVWFATYKQCGGMEEKPHGPSSLIRVDHDGTSTTVATDPRVIVSSLAGPGNAIAYVVDTGDMVVQSNGLRWTGMGKPLAWLDAASLLLSRDTQLFRLDLSAGSLTPFAQLPAAPSVGSLVKP